VRPRRLAGAGLALTAAVLAGCDAGEAPADLVFRGGTIWTADSDAPSAEAVAVRDGRIVYVGAAAGAEALVGEGTEVVDIGGGMLIPGFHDTHVHPVSGGIELNECDLNAAQTRAEVAEIVAGCAARDPDAPWVRGGGFQLPIFPDGAPTRELLDSLVPDRPAFLSSADGHSAWVNTRALQLAGVTAGTADPPPDGIIVRDAAGGPQGTLRESAMDLVGRHVPAHTSDQVLAGLERGLAMASSLGITTLHEASAGEAYAEAWARAEREGKLHARAIVSLTVDTDRGVDQVPELVARRDRHMGSLARPVAAKIFVDGVIEGQTAALLEPYTDRPAWRGELNLHPDTLKALVAALDDAGFKVHIHAIGDRAIRASLDAFEAQHLRDAGAGPRHIMSHIQLFDPADVPRFAALGVAASFQPLWFYADEYITDLTEPRVGPERSRWLYPARSVLESGALVAAGSDWSVSSMDPLRGIEVAVTRRSPDLDEGPAWIPEEVLTVEEMLRAYTINGAAAGDMDRETGSIAVGKQADLALLDTDLLVAPPERISDARVRMTVFQGRLVYRW